MAPPRTADRLAAAALAAAIGCWTAGAAAAEGTSWLRLPAPNLASLEPAVAEQLAELRELAEARAEDPDTPQPELAEAVGELARHYHAYNLEQPALDTYRIARRLATDDFRWVYLEAVLVDTAGRPEEAAALYRRALELAPQATPAWVRLGRALAALGRADEAKAAYEMALERDPDSPAALAGLGEALLAERRFEEAATLLERALELVPEADRLRYPLALAYRGRGDEDAARRELERRGEVGVRPADPVVDALPGLRTGERVYLLRGRSAFRAGDLAAAAEAFARARDANPESVSARVNLAAALEGLGQIEAAMRELEEAVELAPGNSTAYYNLGLLHLGRGEIDAAVARLMEAASYDRDDAEIRYRLAEALRAAGRPSEALPHYRAAQELAPPAERARLGEAAALVDLWRLREARARLEEGHVLLPASGLLAAALARLLAESPDPSLRDGERAVELAEKVYAALPTVPHARLVGAALAEAGRCAEAADWQRALIAKIREKGHEGDLSALDAALSAYEAGPPCRPPMAVEAPS